MWKILRVVIRRKAVATWEKLIRTGRTGGPLLVRGVFFFLFFLSFSSKNSPDMVELQINSTNILAE